MATARLERSALHEDGVLAEPPFAGGEFFEAFAVEDADLAVVAQLDEPFAHYADLIRRPPGGETAVRNQTQEMSIITGVGG